MKIEYRKATNADSEAIALLAVQMWASHTVEDLSNVFSSLMESDNNALFLLIIKKAQTAVRQDIQKEFLYKKNIENKALQNSF